MDFADYIETFMALPLATILIVHILLTHKRENKHNEETLKILSNAFEKQSELLGDAIKVIKHQERKEN